MIYQLLIRLLAPLIVALILWDAYKRKGGWLFIRQRLGFSYPKTTRPGAIWIHCASVGEVNSIEYLVKSRPHQAWLITVNTPTGYQTATRLALSKDIYYLPLDWPFAIKRFLRKAQPSQLWVVETELWPNLYQQVFQNQIPISMINARLAKSIDKIPGWLNIEYQKCLQRVDKVLARSKAEAQRFISLGADPARVQVLGNLKQSGLKQLPDYPRQVTPEYVLLSSSHEDEELQIAKIWQQLNRPECLVIVPRHPKRGVKIQRQLQQHGITAHSFEQTEPDNTTKVWIKNTLGELMPLFAHAKLVIMGGSFVEKGGHNFLEPAALGRAIITGWDNRDFEDELAWFQSKGAIIVCDDYQKLQQRLNQILTNGALLNELGRNAYQVVQSQPDILTAYQQALNI